MKKMPMICKRWPKPSFKLKFPLSMLRFYAVRYSYPASEIASSKSRYPILDFRALWSVGVKAPLKYSFDFWWRYTVFFRRLATRAGVRMRTLDKALWQYSKEHQRRR